MTLFSPNHFIILGASLETGNLGVSALLASTVKCIRRTFPVAKISLFDGVPNPIPQVVQLANGEKIELDYLGIRCNKTAWRQNHLFLLLLTTLIARLLPTSRRKKCLYRNPYLRAIIGARAVMDITGGDSFSDIYGMRRFVLGSLRKILVLLCGVELILLPQTYGPYNSPLARNIARFVLKRASLIYSRDKEGMKTIHRMMKGKSMRCEPRLCPDVAFALDAMKPTDSNQTNLIERLISDGKKIIGLNISGLLYNGGYTQNNMFGLTLDYCALIKGIISIFLTETDYYVLLVPHVIPDIDFAVEDDFFASQSIKNALPRNLKEKVIILSRSYNQSEIKYFVGLCEFFLGARMHATIAALSQMVPAVGMAYSKKFKGVFETAGVADCVIDLRTMNNKEALIEIKSIYSRREDIKKRLQSAIPNNIKCVKEMLNSLELNF